MVALGEKERTSKPVGSHYSIECWFRRAVKFRPDDNIVRMLYAQYLFKAKRENEADQELGVAASQAGDNAFTQNNIGLIYFDMKNYEKALVHAHKAYGLGFGSPTLRNQLRSVGKWSEADVAQPVELPKNPQ
jgi:Flp pilus assembly protein TadD